MDKQPMKALFLYGSSKSKMNSYSYRIEKFQDYFSRKNLIADSIYLKDSFLKVPSLLQPMNLPFLSKTFKDYDFVHAGNTSCAYLMKIHQQIHSGKFIYDVHGDVVQEYLLQFDKPNFLNAYNLLQAWLMELIASHSTYFITCSERLKLHYIKKGVDPIRIETIRNGVDIDFFKPSQNRSKNEKFTVTYAGAFDKWQGIENLVEAIKILDSEDIIFNIIGFTKSDYRLKYRIKSNLEDRVQLIDILPRSDLIHYLDTSDVLIIPRNNHKAINVALPTKFAEYIAMGKPVISTGVDETADLIKKYDCGYICEPNPISIATTIENSRQSSSQKLLQKGINARKLAEKEFDQNSINKKYLQFLNDVLNQ